MCGVERGDDTPSIRVTPVWRSREATVGNVRPLTNQRWRAPRSFLRHTCAWRSSDLKMTLFLPATGQLDWCPAVTARCCRPLPSRARASAKTIDRGKKANLVCHPLRDPCLGRHTPPPSSPPLVPVQIGLAVFRREDISIWLTEFICCARGPGRSWRSVVVRLPLNRPGAGDADLQVPLRTLCSRTRHRRFHFFWSAWEYPASSCVRSGGAQCLNVRGCGHARVRWGATGVRSWSTI